MPVTSISVVYVIFTFPTFVYIRFISWPSQAYHHLQKLGKRKWNDLTKLSRLYLKVRIRTRRTEGIFSGFSVGRVTDPPLSALPEQRRIDPFRWEKVLGSHDVGGQWTFSRCMARFSGERMSFASTRIPVFLNPFLRMEEL